MFDIAQLAKGARVQIDRSRDSCLTEFGKAVLADRYLLPGESSQDAFARVAMFYADDSAHAQRLYDYISGLWFMPDSAILGSGGADRRLPVSCFLNECDDSLSGIVDLWNENVWLASCGGSIGSYWGNLRSLGEKAGRDGKTPGIIPFIHVQDSLMLAIEQLPSAVYLPVSHPEIEEFIDLRRSAGDNSDRKALHLHHGILIPNAFMRAVEDGGEWALTSPKDGSVLRRISARSLWSRILSARIETGEPYLIYIDNVNSAIPEHHKIAGLPVKMSGASSEVMLPTGMDHHGQRRTAVCCMSALNLEKFDEWEEHPAFIEDVLRFLDNALEDFIRRAPDTMMRAKYAAMRERSVGLGVMGFHSFLQSKMIPVESVTAKVWNKRIFGHIRSKADVASVKFAKERDACPDARDYGIMERFSNKLAIAPTDSLSLVAGGISQGIEPYAANAFTHKTLSGSYAVRNPYLENLLAQKCMDDEEVWLSIAFHKGSVQHLDFLSCDEKDVFKTAFELDQKWLIEHAADRVPYICQSQSLDIFVSPDIHKSDLHQIHWMAWKSGVKSLCCCRSVEHLKNSATQGLWEEAFADDTFKKG
ncbi:MAG: ribonucleoside-diphosphate reductase subunit alpha [Alphaproteobacteria bacterium]|nr:ribonucleoside-diphosphate reductase subunit alpha [Alphaproteobacteria bacterium]